MSLGGLLNHLAFVEDLYSTLELDGSTPPERWIRLQTEEGWAEHFHPAAPPEELYATYDDAVARSRARIVDALTRGGLYQLVDKGDPERGRFNLRRLVLDLLEEYGRHTGQADLLREAVDGRVGEDPDGDWVPAWCR